MIAKRLQCKLNKYSADNLLRQRFIIEQRSNNYIVINGKKLLNFCNNNYLRVASHPTVKKAFIEGINKYGVGSSSSVLISGYYQPHYELEEHFAKFLQRDKAILFNSGYHANLGVIGTLANRNSLIIADKLCHASLIDSIILSRAKFHRYNHNDASHAARLMQKIHAQEKLLISESVFSMEGDITPLTKLTNLAKQHNAITIIDDAHSFGVLGENGRGITDGFDQTAVPYLITPLGKAFGGMGAIVSGSKQAIEPLVQFARTYIYTTALPPAISYAGLAALKVIADEIWRRKKLQDNIKLFIKEALLRNLALISTDPTPIKSILIGNNEKTLMLQNRMLEKGFFVSCIRPPTVPANKARIRISLNCMHTKSQIIALLDNLAGTYEKMQ